MPTRSCPTCGSQYVASVRRCIDCDEVLVDDVTPGGEEPTGATATPLGEGDQVGYELEGWGNQLKVTLDGMMQRAGVRYVWEAGALVVSASDEDTVDGLIATLEGDDFDDLDDDVEQVAFEIEDLDAEAQTDLDAALLAEGISHRWSDDDELIVAATDEERVTEIVESVLDPSDDPEGGDGLAANAVLSRLFVAVDRLVKSPTDAKLGEHYHQANQDLQALGVPYGFSAADWSELQASAAHIEGLLDAEEAEARGRGRADDADDGDGPDGDGPDGHSPDDAGVAGDGERANQVVAVDVVRRGDRDEDADHRGDLDDSEGGDEAPGQATRSERIAGAAVALRDQLRDYV